MPELPEVEVVRRGLAEHVLGRTIDSVQVLHPRAIRRYLPGPVAFADRLAGRTVVGVRRRGKYLWLELDESRARGNAIQGEKSSVMATEAVLAHLGMSGQMRVQPVGAADERHLRVRFVFSDTGPELRFVDQRTFGGLLLADLVAADGRAAGNPAGVAAGDHAGGGGGGGVPLPIAHIARDPMEPGFDPEPVIDALRRRRTEIKRALLDQTLVSGVGNIYADEALWRARLHWARPTEKLTGAQAGAVLAAARDVMAEALAAGGTSFDALYVNVNGQSGFFGRSLAVYGQDGRPCPRCGSPIKREPFMNRSSYSCPRCQPAPRRTASYAVRISGR